MEGIGLSTFSILTSYYNIIEVIVNSDDQIFVTKRAKDIDGRNLESISTVSVSVFKNKANVVSRSHCQDGGNYHIYNVYSLTHPEAAQLDTCSTFLQEK